MQSSEAVHMLQVAGQGQQAAAPNRAFEKHARKMVAVKDAAASAATASLPPSIALPAFFGVTSSAAGAVFGGNAVAAADAAAALRRMGSVKPIFPAQLCETDHQPAVLGGRTSTPNSKVIDSRSSLQHHCLIKGRGLSVTSEQVRALSDRKASL